MSQPASAASRSLMSQTSWRIGFPIMKHLALSALRGVLRRRPELPPIRGRPSRAGARDHPRSAVLQVGENGVDVVIELARQSIPDAPHFLYDRIIIHPSI